MRTLQIARALAIAASGAALLAAPALAAPQHAPNHRITHSGTTSTSTNWSGYDVIGTGPYTTVSATWTQPAVNCMVTPSAYSSFWVGLDGDTTNTVEQTGTDSDCVNGAAQYYAWYEMYPKAPVNSAKPLAAGDTITASATYTGGATFNLTVTDVSRSWSQTVSARLKSARRGSAEVIAEAPYSGGVLPLADFGQIGFTSATVDGVPLDGSTPGIDQITMATSSGAVKAQPSAISSGAFTDTWKHQ
jgi:hypothetical protein